MEHLVYWLIFKLLPPMVLGSPNGLLRGGGGCPVLSPSSHQLRCTASLLPSASHVRPGRGDVPRLKDSRQNEDPIGSGKGKRIGKFGTKTWRRYPWLQQPKVGVQQVTQQQIQLLELAKTVSVLVTSLLFRSFFLCPTQSGSRAGLVYPDINTHHVWLFCLFFF